LISGVLPTASTKSERKSMTKDLRSAVVQRAFGTFLIGR
jgi:hypothetical protein